MWAASLGGTGREGAQMAWQIDGPSRKGQAQGGAITCKVASSMLPGTLGTAYLLLKFGRS